MSAYYKMLIDMLRGKVHDRPEIVPSRADLEGVDAVIELFQASGGEKRSQVIEAMGQIIQNADRFPDVASQVLSLASAFDLAQLEPKVISLRGQDFLEKHALLREQVDNFLAYRQVRIPTVQHTTGPLSYLAEC